MAYNPVRTSSSLTATGSVTLGVGGEAWAIVAVTGTYTGVSGLIEGSVDGTTYFALQGYLLGSGAQQSGTSSLSATNKAWYVSCCGLTHIRYRVTAYSSGTVTVTISETTSVPPLNPNTSVQLTTTSGTSTAAIAAGSGNANVVGYAGAGILHRIIVTTAGTASLILYDNATTNSGTQLYASAATYSLGVVTEVNAPFANGITARQASGTAAVTLVYTPFA